MKPETAPTGRRRVLPTLLVLLWSALAQSAVAAADSTAPPARVALRWELERNEVGALAPAGRSHARFILTNTGGLPLPPQGWSIYFNCLSGIDADSVIGELRIERVAGGLFRMQPVPGFGGLAPGQGLQLRFAHDEILFSTTKAPLGPYLVLDRAPGEPQAISDYQAADSPDPTGVITADDLYQRNASIAELPEESLTPVLPTPRHLERRSGALLWAAPPLIIAAPALQPEAALARTLLQPYFAAEMSGATGAGATGAGGTGAQLLRLRLAPIPGETSAEAYELEVDPAAGVTLTGGSAAGLARGLATLHELLPVQPQPQQGIRVPALFIRDAPRFAYRGLQLDVARNFESKQVVLRLLDLMARYKLNVFHFHLTDDEGWRLEIAGLPELTSVGARRGHTLDSAQFLPPAYGSGPDVSDPHGSGYYRRADYIEILRYAAARHIEVIPEIEMPGHARAAIMAMENRYRTLTAAGRADAGQYRLADPQDRSAYLSAQLYTDNVINPCLPSAHAFIAHVVTAVVALHREAGVPLRTIHVGGDEVPMGTWTASPACHAFMQRRKLAAPADVWNVFYQQVNATLRQHHLFASGWEELGSRRDLLQGSDQLVPNPYFAGSGFTLYVWRNIEGAEDLAYRLANAGYDTVLVPATRLYFDMARYPSPDEPGQDWAAYAGLQEAFSYIPYDDVRRVPTDATPLPGKVALTDPGKRHVRGLEGALFTETVRGPARLDYMIMPRLLALAERAWAPDPEWAQARERAQAEALYAAAWSRFVNQLGKRELPRLDAEQAGIQYRIAPPGLRRVDGQVLVNQQLPGFALRYTSDGGEPTVASPLVSGPIVAQGIIRVAAFDRNGRSGRSSRIANP